MNKKHIFLAATLSVAVLLSACGQSASYKDGNYAGSGKGKEGDIQVAVVVKDHKIASIDVLNASETAGVGAKAVQKIIAEILDKQSVEVDNVSGATYSSNGIKEAVGNALKDAH